MSGCRFQPSPQGEQPVNKNGITGTADHYRRLLDGEWADSRLFLQEIEFAIYITVRVILELGHSPFIVRVRYVATGPVKARHELERRTERSNERTALRILFIRRLALG